MTWHIFLLIPFVLYIGSIVTAFNDRWSTALMMLYLGSIFVIALEGLGWFVFMLVASDPVGIAVAVAGTFAMAIIAGLLLRGVDLIRRRKPTPH
jgi:hypothetical protein